MKSLKKKAEKECDNMKKDKDTSIKKSRLAKDFMKAFYLKKSMDDDKDTMDKIGGFISSVFARIIFIIVRLFKMALAMIIPGIFLVFAPFIILLLIIIGAGGGSIDAEYEKTYATPSDACVEIADGATFVFPVSGVYYVTSIYGERWGTIHGGIDLAAPMGTPILAGADGVVSSAGYSNSMGYYVKIDHGNGMETIYMHNSVLLVSSGDNVIAGEQIALSGSTGDSTGPHCHFGVYINGERVNPAPYLGLPLDVKDHTDVTDIIKGLENKTD